jgi:hypothetical protein
MKRDLELIKQILLRVESRDHVERDFSIPGYNDKVVAYHVAIMEQAGLLDAIVHKMLDGTMEGIPIRMTWLGHEWIDLARDNGRWKKAKKLVKEKVGSVSVELMKVLLTNMAKELLLPNHPNS